MSFRNYMYQVWKYDVCFNTGFTPFLQHSLTCCSFGRVTACMVRSGKLRGIFHIQCRNSTDFDRAVLGQNRLDSPQNSSISPRPRRLKLESQSCYFPSKSHIKYQPLAVPECVSCPFEVTDFYVCKCSN